jgi:hypothetical protein
MIALTAQAIAIIPSRSHRISVLARYEAAQRRQALWRTRLMEETFPLISIWTPDWNEMSRDRKLGQLD